MFGKPAIGEQELDKAVDKFAVKVVQTKETVDHLLREYSQILWYFIAHGGKWVAVDVAANARA